jgi:hypothetical protein
MGKEYLKWSARTTPTPIFPKPITATFFTAAIVISPAGFCAD